MYEKIRNNKIKSFFLCFFFAALVLALGWVFGQFSGFGYWGLILAAVIAILMSIGAYYYSDKIVLRMSKARPLEKHEYPFLFHTIEGLTIASGLPAPRAYIIDDTAPNAFATGRNPQHAVICVTTGLLQKLNRLELEGVIAHEMSHIKNYDMLLMTMTVVMVGIVALLSDWMYRVFWYGGGRRKSRSRSGGSGGGAAILMVIALLLAILAPLIAQLIKLAISRRREFLADADGALLTRYPEGLASALEKLDADYEPLEVANKATAHLYIINPLREHRRKFNSLFSTHPPTQQRIAALREM